MTFAQTLVRVLPADRNWAQDGLPPQVLDYLKMIELQDSQPLNLNPRHGVRWKREAGMMLVGWYGQAVAVS